MERFFIDEIHFFNAVKKRINKNGIELNVRFLKSLKEFCEEIFVFEEKFSGIIELLSGMLLSKRMMFEISCCYDFKELCIKLTEIERLFMALEVELNGEE